MSLGLFSTLVGSTQEMKDTAIEVGSALGSMALAKMAMEEIGDRLPDAAAPAKPFLPVIPILGGLFLGNYLRRYDVRVAAGVRLGLVAYGTFAGVKAIAAVAKNEQLTSLVSKIPLAGLGDVTVPLLGLGAYGLGMDAQMRSQGLGLAPTTVERLRGAPTTARFSGFRGAPSTATVMTSMDQLQGLGGVGRM
jgi:hypothetical protein